MNIIPMILFSIIALAAFVTAFRQKSTDLAITHHAIIGFTTAAREAANQVEIESFEKLRKEREKKEKKEPKEKTASQSTRTVASSRDTAKLTDAAKINIFPLFTDHPNKHLKPVFTNLMKELYAHLYTPNELTNLIESMITSGKNCLKEKQVKNSQSTEIWFEDLYPQDPANRERYYRLLRGTKHYNIETKEGHPPLTDYISFQSSDKIANFTAVPLPILSALFTKKIALEILAKEKELRESEEKKQKCLTKAQLEPLLSDLSITEALDFKQPSQKIKPITVQDPKTLVTFSMPTE